MLRILKEITEQMHGKEIVHGTWISERGWKELTVPGVRILMKSTWKASWSSGANLDKKQ